MSPVTVCLTCGRKIPRGTSYCHQHTRRNGSTRAWRKVRASVLARDDYTCRYCGQPADTVDHVHPVALGGSSDPANLAAACRSCNGRKGSGVPRIPSSTGAGTLPPSASDPPASGRRFGADR